MNGDSSTQTLVLCHAQTDGLDLTAFLVFFRVSVSVSNFLKGGYKAFSLKVQRCQIQWMLTGFDLHLICDLALETLSGFSE